MEISEKEQEQALAEEKALKGQMDRYFLLVEELEQQISLQAKSAEQCKRVVGSIAYPKRCLTLLNS